jgi:hypothetical protein
MRRSFIGVLAVLALGGAAAADVVWPAKRPSPPTAAAITPGGVWGCPWVYAGNGRAWLHLINAGNESSRIRITYVRDDAPSVVSNLVLGARHAASLPFNMALKKATAAIVEYAGGDLFASRTAIVEDAGARRSGGAGAACSRASTGVLAVPTGSTLNADTTLSILNPATSDATVDVSLVTIDDEIKPERLQGFVVPRRSRRTIRIGDYAFDEGRAGAVVHIRSGRVVVDGLLATGTGLTLVPAQEPASSMIGLAISERGSARLDALAPGENDLVIRASLLGTDSRTVLGEPSDKGLEALVPATFALTARSAAMAVTLESREGGPFVAATRWHAGSLGPASSRRRVDLAAATGLVAARRLVAVSGPPASGAQTKIVIANPGETPAAVTLTLMRGTNPVSLGVRTVAAGRVVAFDAGRFGGVVGVEASSDVPVAMMLAGLAPQAKFFAAFAIAAVPFGGSPSVAVDIDERAGVPAS